MYCRFYDLAREPFNITPDPDFLYLSEGHRAALASTIDAIDSRKGVVTVTGDVGVGKTTIIRSCLEKGTAADLAVVYLFYPAVTFPELIISMYRELDIDFPGDSGVAGMMENLRFDLEGLWERGKTVVVVIDDAQNIPVDTMKNLPLLSSLEKDGEKLLQIILAGQTELNEVLEKDGLGELRRHIAVSACIPPLTVIESRAYIEHRLSRAGLNGHVIFEKKAIDIIVREARGVPRTLNILCDNALITGFGYHRRPVTGAIAREVASNFMTGGLRAKGGLVPVVRPLRYLHGPAGAVPAFFASIRHRVLARTSQEEKGEEPGHRKRTIPPPESTVGKDSLGDMHMSGDYIGSLSPTRLFEILMPLIEGKKSGMVIVEGDEKQEIYLEGGAVLHGRKGALTGEEALTALLELDEGRVIFNWQLSPEKRTIETPTGELLAGWRLREEEWGKIRQVIGTSDTVFSIVVDSGGKDRLVPESQWGILALCNGMRSASDIAGILSRPLVDVCRTISDMVETGILEKSETFLTARPQASRATVDGEFFTTLERELKKVVGPIGRVIIVDTMAAFEASFDAFPLDRAGDFVKAVSEQIPEEGKREAFERSVGPARATGQTG